MMNAVMNERGLLLSVLEVLSPDGMRQLCAAAQAIAEQEGYSVQSMPQGGRKAAKTGAQSGIPSIDTALSEAITLLEAGKAPGWQDTVEQAIAIATADMPEKGYGFSDKHDEHLACTVAGYALGFRDGLRTQQSGKA